MKYNERWRAEKRIGGLSSFLLAGRVTAKGSLWNAPHPEHHVLSSPLHVSLYRTWPSHPRKVAMPTLPVSYLGVSRHTNVTPVACVVVRQRDISTAKGGVINPSNPLPWRLTAQQCTICSSSIRCLGMKEHPNYSLIRNEVVSEK